MRLQHLEKKAGAKFPKEFRDTFEKLIDGDEAIRLKLLNDDYTLIKEYIPRQDLYDYDYIVHECFIPCLKRYGMYKNEYIIPFAKSSYGDGHYYLYYKVKKKLFRADEYEIWMNHIDAGWPPQKIADSLCELIDIHREEGVRNDVVFFEKKKFSDYINNFQKTIFKPEIGFTQYYLDVRTSSIGSNWQFESYLKLIKVELPENIYRMEEITVEHIILINGYHIHYQLPLSYTDKIESHWFEPKYFEHYGTRENHYNFDFFKKIEYIAISLKHMLEQIAIKEPSINTDELINLIDTYDIRSVLNKSHLEFELQIP